MRHAVPFLIIALAGIAVASILLPSEPWTQSFVVRTIAILAVGVACYLGGFATGKRVIRTAAHPSHQFEACHRSPN